MQYCMTRPKFQENSLRVEDIIPFRLAYRFFIFFIFFKNFNQDNSGPLVYLKQNLRFIKFLAISLLATWKC